MVDLITEYSPCFLPLCVLAGTGLAYLLYTQKNVPWNMTLNKVLFAVRAILLSLLLILLLGPYVKSRRNIYEKPSVVIAVDNSMSIPLVTDSAVVDKALTQLKSLGESLKGEDYNVELRTFDGFVEEKDFGLNLFDKQTSDLSGMLGQIQSQYENKNLAGVVLLTDGIYNQGFSPSYTPYSMNIYPVGIGDTLPQTDVNLKAVYSNKITYTGNKFPMVAEIANTGFEGKKAEVELLHNGKILDRKSISFTKRTDLQQVKFLAEAKKKGMQRFLIRIKPLEGEFTSENNQKNVYIDVLEGKEKILLVAASPHPDIKTIRSAVEKNKNYELHVHIPGMKGEGLEGYSKKEKYGLAIMHQVPDKRAVGTQVMRELKKRGIPMWFIVGGQSDINTFNQENKLLTLQTSGNQKDNVTGVFNTGFDLFTFEDEKKEVVSKLPPVSVPFGEVKVGGGADVMIYQRVGNIKTKKPLLVAGEQNGYKSAVMLGDGLWLWRLQEFLFDKNQEAVDELIGKMVQYLATKEDRRRFRVYPVAEEFSDAESVLFQSEVYNDIYERIFGQKIELQITSEDGETKAYTFENISANFKYPVNDLKEGIYSYKASTVLNGKTETSEGQFTVKAVQLEALNTTADFNLLRNLANQSGGKFYQEGDLAGLQNHLKNAKPADIIHTQEKYEELSSLEWILALLLVLATVEWVVRKVKGSY
ncbi:VWA domain-containing protein [Limibacter armeniacum]|uniref:VWA domain-containing protein n=1 Tax=Limibacter armeniacum TaxID=466084 RepID=UPI002FE577F4